MATPRTILDTNVVVSGFLNPERPAGRILDSVFRDSVPMLLSETLAAEYRSALSGPRLAKRVALSSDDVEEFVRLLEARSELVVPPRNGVAAPDHRDQHLWDLLFKVPDAVLATGERRLLLGAPPGREVLSPQQFVERYLGEPVS